MRPRILGVIDGKRLGEYADLCRQRAVGRASGEETGTKAGGVPRDRPRRRRHELEQPGLGIVRLVGALMGVTDTHDGEPDVTEGERLEHGVWRCR